MIIYLLILTFIHALIDAIRIRKDMPIRHGMESLAFAALCTPLLIWHPWYWIAPMAITTRAAIFDIALNLLRGKGWLYNGAGSSLIDRIENRTGISMLWIRIGCIGLYLITSAIYLLT